jgi:colicin import membrane protein
MHIRNLLAACLIVAPAAWAQMPTPASAAPLSLEEAHAVRVRAEAMKAEAERRYAADQAACYQKFLVNDCLDAVRVPYTKAMIEARELDKTGRDVEREARRQELDAKDAARAAEAPQRAAEQQAEAERYRAEEAAKAAERQRKLADKAKQAEEGRRQAAAEQAARQEKLAKRAREDAERAAKKAAAAAATPAK